MQDGDIDVGLALPTFFSKEVPLDYKLMSDTAIWAERKGFHRVCTPDHIFHGWQIMESIVCLSYVAARTSRIGLSTSILLLAMRQVSVAAAQLATLSILSEGRFSLGVGNGGEWPKEWVAAGVPLKERGVRLDEQLELLKRLFAGEIIDFQGRFHNFPGVALSPTPPHIPFYLAGRAEAALERVGKYSDGWLAYYLTPNGFRRDKSKVDEARERHGRSGTPFKYDMTFTFLFDDNNVDADLRAARAYNATFPPGLQLTDEDKLRNFVLGGTPSRVLERMQEYIDLGCNSFCLSPLAEGEKRLEHLEILASEVLPKLKNLRVS